MPIYEYYCAKCHGRFSHLAKRIGEPAPACPRCGNVQVERMVSAASVIHDSPHHERTLREASQHVDADDDQAIANFLKNSGRLEDAEGVYGSKAYRELISRRAEGATDADVADLVDDLVTEMSDTDATKMSGAVMFSDRVENRMFAEGPPDDHEHESASENPTPSPRSADDLGWG